MSDLAENKFPTSLSEQEFSLLSQANDEFIKKRYTNCYDTISLLEQSIGSGGKILHNKAVVEFYKSDCKDYKTFLKFLNQDILQAERNPDEVIYRNMTLSYYNKAILLFHLRKPYAAINLLRPSVQKIEDIDEPLKSKVGLLMLILLLSTNQYKKAHEFLDSFQKLLGVAALLPTTDEIIDTPIASPTDINSFSRMLKLISMLTGILNNKIITIPDDGSIEYTFLKAHQYYLGKDFQMAAKQLSKEFSVPHFTVSTHGDDQDVCLANNMGIIHLRVRHYAIAAQFFQHSIQFDNKLTANIKEASVLNIGASKKPEILYNLGIAMLHLQRPKEAFECFLVPLKIYQNNPRLWLRVAESCIMLYEKNAKLKESKHIVSSVIGSGLHRKFLIHPNTKLFCAEDGQTFAIPNPNLEFAALCLRNAVSLAEHNKHIFAKKSATDTSPSDSSTQPEQGICNPSAPISSESFDRLLAAIYTAYSYVCIRLGDFTIALEYAKLLLKLENLSDEMAMLGHLYCAESLIMLNRVNEARVFLDQNFISNLNSQDFETKDWQINSIDAAQSVLRYNLAITLVLQGEFNSAKKILASCTHPVVFTKYKMLKMYIELATGNLDNCKIMIQIDTPQFR